MLVFVHGRIVEEIPVEGACEQFDRKVFTPCDLKASCIVIPPGTRALLIWTSATGDFGRDGA